MKEKSVGQKLKASSKSKRPDQQTYVIPSARADGDSCEYSKGSVCVQSRSLSVAYIRQLIGYMWFIITYAFW